MSFREALHAVGSLRDEGIVVDIAIGGAMAMGFWAEPVATYDLDVFALFPSTDSPLVTLAPLYDWAAARGYAVEREHIVIAGVPVQVIPTHDALAEEAVREAVTLDYEGLPVRVIRPEHLIALCLEPSARTRKRLARVAALLEGAEIDRERLDSILRRFDMSLPGGFE
jgi:hypothetical protein